MGMHARPAIEIAIKRNRAQVGVFSVEESSFELELIFTIRRM